MKDYRSRAANNPDEENWDPITREADNQKIVILHNFIIASEKEHPSFGAPDNDDIYINPLFLYCLRRYGIDVDPVTVAHEAGWIPFRIFLKPARVVGMPDPF